MTTSLIISLLIAVVVIYILATSLKIANEDERYAKFVLGRFAGYIGPGLVLKSQASRVYRLKIGDVGTLTSTEFARFGDADIPISVNERLGVGDSVRIEAFDEKGPRLVSSPIPVKSRCPKCGHEY